MGGFCHGVCLLFLCCLAFASTSLAQEPERPNAVVGQSISPDVLTIYRKGLGYLAQAQNERGTWPAGESAGPGTTGLAVLAFLASGEDPNFGKHREVIRKGLRHIINAQSDKTGYIGPSMYHHGFATLCLCEAYGVVDDRNLFDARGAGEGRRLARAVELATGAAMTAQKRNRQGAWRYSPVANDADTSVSGAVMMSLLAARNAGFEVPDDSINRAVDYFSSMTAGDGSVGYASESGGSESIARSSIANLVFAIAKRKDLPAHGQTRAYLIANRDTVPKWTEYARYYQAQALFQSDVDQSRQWNDRLVRELKQLQKADGSFDGEMGVINSTSLNLLALAVNFRFLPIYER